MNSSDIRIVYMGTPEFATAPLRALADEGMNITAVITTPDKPAGRGMKLRESAVKQFAASHLGCPIFQPENLKDPGFVDTLKSLNADLFIVVAFRMLPEVVWSIPKKGTFNLHASLLPQYRGAAPINHAIINGETETGVSTFLIDEKIDTGQILYNIIVNIESGDDAGTLHDKLMVSGAELVVKTAASIMSGSAEPVPQDTFKIPDDQLKKAPKIFKEDCRINWEMELDAIANLIRGLSPFPAAISELSSPEKEKIYCKVYSGKAKGEQHKHLPGAIISDNKSFLHVAVKDGFYSIDTLHIAGKKRMSVGDFLRGFQGDIEAYSFT
jgi:methionyl-tRNA formyltransferase